MVCAMRPVGLAPNKSEIRYRSAVGATRTWVHRDRGLDQGQP